MVRKELTEFQLHTQSNGAKFQMRLIKTSNPDSQLLI